MILYLSCNNKESIIVELVVFPLVTVLFHFTIFLLQVQDRHREN